MADSIAAVPVRSQFTTGYTVTWGFAELGKMMVLGTFGALLPIFYQDYLGLPAHWIATASVIYAAWNAINDPLFGYVTDNTRSRHGRRIPYVRFTAPFLGLSFVLVWLAPRGAAEPALFGWMLVTMLAFDTCFTIVGLVTSALLPEVTESDQERHRLQTSTALFGLLGLLLGFLIPDLFRPKAGEAVSFLPLQASMVAVAAISTALLLVYARRVKERPEFHIVDQPVPLGAMFRYTFSSRSFLVLVAANFMVILMNALLLGALFYLADYVLKTNALLPLAAVFVPLVLGVPATQLVRRRVGVVATQQIFLTIAAVGLLLLAVAPNALILPCLVMVGFGLAGPQTLTNLLFAQVADEDELRSGVRREGAFFGINAFLTKPAQSIALAIQPFILAATGFVTREANAGVIYPDQPAGALWGIRILMGAIPGIALLLAAFFLHWFPLRGLRLGRMQADILVLHAKKHAELVRRGEG